MNIIAQVLITSKNTFSINKEKLKYINLYLKSHTNLCLLLTQTKPSSSVLADYGEHAYFQPTQQEKKKNEKNQKDLVSLKYAMSESSNHPVLWTPFFGPIPVMWSTLPVSPFPAPLAPAPLAFFLPDLPKFFLCKHENQST